MFINNSHGACVFFTSLCSQEYPVPHLALLPHGHQFPAYRPPLCSTCLCCTVLPSLIPHNPNGPWKCSSHLATCRFSIMTKLSTTYTCPSQAPELTTPTATQSICKPLQPESEHYQNLSAVRSSIKISDPMTAIFAHAINCLHYFVSYFPSVIIWLYIYWYYIYI